MGDSKSETIFPVLWATVKIVSIVSWQKLNAKTYKWITTSFALNQVDVIPHAFIYLF